MLLASSGVHAVQQGQVNDPTVPSRYRTLYSELETKLKDLRAIIKSQKQGKNSDTAFGVELLVANSNRGEILLEDRVFRSTCLTLDRLKDLGVQSVAISIQYPILVRSFPRSSEYLQFYERVVREVRNRGFVLVVEMGTTFLEPEFSKLRVDYSGLTMDRFQKELRQMAEVIVDGLRPNYFTLFTEPDTHSRNTGLDFTLSDFITTVRNAAQGLNRPGVRLGAGAGTWDDMTFFESLVKIPELDYIDMHIYPIQRDFVMDRIVKVATMAQGNHKSVSIGEAWLYKVSENELGSTSATDVFARDVYSFWKPLDQLFLEIIVDLSHHVDASFCSFFWMKYLYGYLDYNTRTMNLPPQQLINSVDAISGRKILNNTLNETGERFKILINPIDKESMGDVLGLKR